MNTREKAARFWEAFCSSSGTDAALPHQIWHFGNTAEMADELANLVVSGKKTATASLVEANALRPEETPIFGGFSVVTDIENEPICVVQTTEVRHIPFDRIDEQFAFDEGEGDRSYRYWREVHWNYFTNEARELGIEFNERSLICCERFKLLFVNEL
ncbi:MAG: ASCH domain-containing protein [Pyrinomonadaceae bacterium]